MKRSKMMLPVLLLLGAVPASAQQLTDHRESLMFGLKGGMNYSNVWDEQGQDFEADPATGFAGGAFLAIPVGKYLGVQPELLIVQKGFQGSGMLLGQRYTFSRTTTYLDIPLQVTFKPAEQLTIIAGPQYSYLLSQNDRYTYGSNSAEQQQEFENDNIRKNIMGFVIGADFNINHVVISGRSGWDFQTNHGDGTSSTPRYKNQWLQLTLGYRF